MPAEADHAASPIVPALQPAVNMYAGEDFQQS
jgi:hypothetical protein